MNNASEVVSLLKDNKLKVTKNRKMVLDFLIKSAKPVTAEEVSKKLKINIVTAYRILEVFVSKNLIYQTDFRQGKSFFEYQDKDNHHHHITCSSCGDREHVDFCVEKSIQSNLKNSNKFSEINGHILEFFGICNKCAKK